jgi:alkylation response protein AidB-like acyl-CoA dehydrogenase
MQQQAAEALDAAKALRSLILENRHETETNRRVAEPIIQGLIDSKLGRMALPTEYAGLEVPPANALEIFETLAEAEASVAWIVWNSSLPCWFARFLAEDARGDIFGDPRALYASSTRPSGRATREGEFYVVNGRWGLVSGCMHASWIPVMCMVEEGGEVQMLAPNVPHMRLIFVPREAHEILDTWHVGGLRGTGSHDSMLRDVSVPATRTFAMGDPSSMDSPMGRMPIFCTMSAGCASICLGIAKGSLHALLDLGAEKAPVDGGPGLRDRAPVQSLVARAEATLESVRERLRSTCDKLWNEAVAGAAIDPKDIAAVLGASITASQECRNLVTEIYAAAGTSSLYTDSPIERGHRDIHAVMQHIALQPFWLEQAGRVQLGLEATHPLFSL